LKAAVCTIQLNRLETVMRRPFIPPAPVILAAVAFALLTEAAAAQAGMLTTTGNAGEVQVPDSPALVPANGYTIEAWFYYNPQAPGGPSNPTILRKNTFTPSYLLRVTSTSGGNLQYYANTGGNYYVVTSTVPTPLNSWHHIAGTHDGQIARLYLDGVLVGSTPCPGPPGFVPGALQIARGDPGSESWRGSIDEVRLWSVVKSGPEIQADMLYERDNVPNLVAAWHFNGNYLDLTGNHDGTPNNQVAIVPSTCPVIGEEITAPALSPIGAPLHLTIKSAFPTLPYLADVSITGNSPGLYIPPPVDDTLPLNPPLLNLTYGSYFDSYFVGFLGFIGANGLATVTLNVPNMPSLIGVPIYASYVLLDPAYPLGIRLVGNGCVTTLTGPAPVVTSVQPATSPASGGASVTIHGSNFVNGATVMIGTAPATNVMFVDSQTLTCTTPAQALGPKAVKVTNPDTTFGTLANGISYVLDLVINSIAPPLGLAGSAVSVTGVGFVPGLTLAVGGIPVIPTAVNVAAVNFTVPAGVPCDASVVVTNPDGQTQSVLWNRAPVVTSTIGAMGPPSGGATFFILGSNFYPGTTVTVGGANATVLNTSLPTLFVQAPAGTLGPATIVVSSLTGCTATSTYLYQ
jgi:hypothetical protein